MSASQDATAPSGAGQDVGAAGPRAARILVVDDEEAMRHFLERGLTRLGYRVVVLAEGDAAVRRWSAEPFDVAVVDLRMPGCDGLEVLGRVRAQDPQAAVVLMTAYGTIATAVEAMQLGARDFVTKPFEIEELALRIERVLESRVATAAERTGPVLRPDALGIVAQSAALRALLEKVELLRGSDATVLLTGESGTGKNLVARALHKLSPRAQGPFVELHCAALPEALLEVELFGREAGAGGAPHKPGLLARAQGGTLLLDEIGELSLGAQARVETFLQERAFVPVGGGAPRSADVRVLAASTRDLQAAAAAGTFRPELYYRLNVVHLHVPPLRERREDVPALVAHHLRRIAERERGRAKTVTAEAMALLRDYAWPGNVRELQNVVERLAVFAGGRESIGAGDLPAEIRANLAPPQAPTTYADATSRFDREFFSALLTRCRGNVTKAAETAGISTGQLRARMRAAGIDPDQFR
ncbi:MAG: sigma-54-dependent Fis family transcriptional regulator [Planctomycetes bacterium]|nr:sigma-54-dependent Fis family transcriptional regulator [Planctomycetota bacterium]